MAAALDIPQSRALRPAAEHIVDVLIKERAPRLSGSPLWPVARIPLYALLGYRKARAMADAVAAVSGREAMAYASGLLKLQVSVHGMDRIPRSGRLVVVFNHPTGLADGVAAYDALGRVRPDQVYFGNADALRINPRFDEVLIPVEWVLAKRSQQSARDTLKLARAALEAERALVIFPAGRISRRGQDGRLADLAWAPSALSLARRHGAPVLPIHMRGPPSSLFWLFDRLSPELRDITLFHELLNKRGGAFQLTVGPVIAPDAISDPAEMTPRLKAYVEEVLPADPDRPFA